MFKCNFLCFWTSWGLVTKTKMKAKEKQSVVKWPQIFDRMNHQATKSAKDCGQCHVFGIFFFTIFLAFSEAPFQTFFFENLRPHFKTVLCKITFLVQTLCSKMCSKKGLNCVLKVQPFWLNLSSRVLPDFRPRDTIIQINGNM